VSPRKHITFLSSSHTCVFCYHNTHTHTQKHTNAGAATLTQMNPLLVSIIMKFPDLPVVFSFSATWKRISGSHSAKLELEWWKM